MPTSVYLRCSKCKEPLTEEKTLLNGEKQFVCPHGHQRVYKSRYIRRFMVVGRADDGVVAVPNRCPKCGCPANDRATNLVKIECCQCGAILVYDQIKHQWVQCDE